MKISASDWPTVSALFDQALDLPAPERLRWLDELPPQHRAHRPTLEALLASHASVETGDFLQSLPRIGVVDEPAAEPAAGGRTVGPYRLLRELGRGGMGSVWLAQRSDGLLKRQVALKLPHPGLATAAFAERLVRERDILAALAHPHIARLYDAGVTPEGQPYLALAYIEGRSLLAHCDAAGLGLRERIGLFLQVLAAVQYAHSHLVIHRDLKPSNVLVDADGRVHLLDFGIAKLAVEGLAEATELTLDAGLALTPDYASPEQIAGSAVGTASDIYSLGVLLYELLAGARPYRLQHDGRAALQRALEAVEVPRPSTAARAAGRDAIARRLRGDLDTIVLKALKKAPEQRYRTADAFAEDLQRHLDGVPVLARPDSTAYRVGRFVQRHRVGVAAALVVVLALGAGLAGTAWQARRAQQQARRAGAVQDFLVGLFNEADPAKAQGRELTARQMLDRGRRDLEARLNDQPELMDTMRGVLIELYTKLGDESKVQPLAEAQRDRALQAYGSQSLAYGDALYALARVHGGLSHHALALQTYEQAHQVLQRHASERAAELLLIEGHEATQLSMLDRSKEAVDRFVDLLPRLEAFFGAGSWPWLRHAATLAGTYTDLGEHAKSAALIERIVPVLDHADAAHALEAAELRINIGYAQWNARRYDTARSSLEQGIREADRLLGPVNTMSIEAQRTLGLLLVAQGQYGLAARTCGDSVARSRQLSGEDAASTRYAESFDVLPLVFTGHADEARAMALSSVQQLARVEGITPPVARGFDRRLGLAWLFAGDSRKAVQVLEDVLARERSAGVVTGGAHATTLLYLAGARAGQGRQQEAAEAAHEAALAFAAGEVNVVGGAHAKLTEALARARLGQTDAAAALVAQAQALLAGSTRPNPAEPLYAELVRAEVLRAAGHAGESEQLERATRERLAAVSDVALPRRLLLVI